MPRISSGSVSTSANVLQGHLSLAVCRDKLGADLGELEPLLHHGFGDPEPCGDIGGRHAALDQRPEGVELVGGMHLFALDVFGKADFRGVRFVIEDMARNIHVSLYRSGVREGFQSEKPPASGDDGVFAALVFPHNKRLKQAMRGDGRGQLVDAFIGIGLADVALPCEQLVQGDGGVVGGHVVLFRFE
jgi:hypothetical protein